MTAYQRLRGVWSRLVFGMALGLLSGSVLAADSAAPSGPDARAIIQSTRKIITTDGIQTQGMVRIGGIDQWISVRSRHRDNPVLLFLHGGPGFTSIPSSYYFMSGWEEYFTFVQWDQRGAGKTFGAHSARDLRSTMNLERMLADAEEVVEYLRRTYGRQKIVLVGHSWGTVLGTLLAQRHPDWFYVYVGIGQVVEAQQNERLGFEQTLAAARVANDRKAIAELEAMAPFPDPAHPERTVQNLPRERYWLGYFGGYIWPTNQGYSENIGKLNPDYSAQDWENREAGQDYSYKALWTQILAVDFTKVQFDCPVVFLHGRHDLTTSATLMAQWFPSLRAPSKQLVWFEDSGHEVFEQEPGKVLVTLVQTVLPLIKTTDCSRGPAK